MAGRLLHPLLALLSSSSTVLEHNSKENRSDDSAGTRLILECYRNNPGQCSATVQERHEYFSRQSNLWPSSESSTPPTLSMWHAKITVNINLPFSPAILSKFKTTWHPILTYFSYQKEIPMEIYNCYAYMANSKLWIL